MRHDSPPAALSTPPKVRGDSGAIVLIVAVATLYFAREILIPFAFALTLTFLLTPAVILLQKLHTGRVVYRAHHRPDFHCNGGRDRLGHRQSTG